MNKLNSILEKGSVSSPPLDYYYEVPENCMKIVIGIEG